ncbi:MAG: DUF2520 domain-containing protein [Gammaproteobacteria bacterium]|nr:DUF2520 domain-containing protein [Gammaproteobacteria bacterium]
MKPSVSLIGAGAAGSALLLALHRLGYPITAVSSRSERSAMRCAALVGSPYATSDNASASRRGEIVIIATPDGVIGAVCRTLVEQQGIREGQLVLHLSGALGAAELKAAAMAGADTCALHPIQTLVKPQQGADLLRAAWFCLEGAPPGVERARELAMAISGHAFSLDAEQKPLYHAALCVSSNYLVVLENIAVEMLQRAGLERGVALQALLPLIRGAAENLAQAGLPEALTGPISRGDVRTVERHLESLAQGSGEHARLYHQLGRAALRLAREKGQLSASAEEVLKRMLLP